MGLNLSSLSLAEAYASGDITGAVLETSGSSFFLRLLALNALAEAGDADRIVAFIERTARSAAGPERNLSVHAALTALGVCHEGFDYLCRLHEGAHGHASWFTPGDWTRAGAALGEHAGSDHIKRLGRMIEAVTAKGLLGEGAVDPGLAIKIQSCVYVLRRLATVDRVDPVWVSPLTAIAVDPRFGLQRDQCALIWHLAHAAGLTSLETCCDLIADTRIPAAARAGLIESAAVLPGGTIVAQEAAAATDNPLLLWAAAKLNALMNLESASGCVLMAGFHGSYRLDTCGLDYPDSGGQLIYQLELLQALADSSPDHIRLITRGVAGRHDLSSYADGDGQLMRLPFGPDRYLRRRDLWLGCSSFLHYLEEYIAFAGRPGCIHLHSGDAVTATAARWAIAHKIPVVFTMHSAGLFKLETMTAGTSGAMGNDLHPAAAEELFERIRAEELLLKNCAALIVSTKSELAKQLRWYRCYQELIDVDRGRVIAPGTQIRDYPSSPRDEAHLRSRALAGLDESAGSLPFFGLLSRFESRKNILGFIENWLLSGLWQSSNLLIGGSYLNTPVHAEIQAFLTAHPHLRGKVILLGALDRRLGEVTAFYKILATGFGETPAPGVFVNPAFYEPFGLTIIEAMAMGLVTAATANGGPAEFIEHGSNGYLFDPTDTRTMAPVLGGALREAVDKTRGVGVRAMACYRQQFQWSRQVRHFMDLYAAVQPGGDSLSMKICPSEFGGRQRQPLH